jgi:hypothetical protein
MRPDLLVAESLEDVLVLVGAADEDALSLVPTLRQVQGQFASVFAVTASAARWKPQ